MANKVTNIHVKDSADAFNVAARFMPGDWEDDRQASARAGYPVYRCYGDGLYYNYICDLGNRLEVNLGDGSTVNVWIDADAEEDFTAAPAAAAAPAVTPAEGSQSGAAAVSIRGRWRKMFAVRSLSSRAAGAVRLVFREKHFPVHVWEGSQVVRVDTWEAGANRCGAAHWDRWYNSFGGRYDRARCWCEYVRDIRARRLADGI